MTISSIPQSLHDRFADVLPAEVDFTFYHASTPPTKCDPLFVAPPGQKQQRTYCETQFLTLSIPKPGFHHDEQVLVFAIEILIYTTQTLTTIFVSKADSTGYLSLLDDSNTAKGSPIRAITSAFVSWLIEHRQRPGIRLVVSLFARAQNQYLFPGSVEHPGKHVLDDRQLVRWWCKTLDPVLRESKTNTIEDSEATKQAYVIVPGFDKHETTGFFPPTWRSDPVDDRKWQYGHPLRDIAPYATAPPRCLVPHFPDDPKARFLDELDEEIPDTSSSQTLSSPSKRGRGIWKSIKTLDQFWDTMAFRQECSSGRLVGFIWIVFTPSHLRLDSQTDSFDSQISASSLIAGSQEVSSTLGLCSSEPNTAESPKKKSSRRKKLTGPIIPRQPRIKSSSSSLSSTSQAQDSPYWRWPETGRGQVVLDQASYTRVHDLLLRLDFANANAATKSTRKWTDEVIVISGSSRNWGKTVTGLRKGNGPPVAATVRGATSPAQPNNLSGMIVRKKRKPDSAEQNEPSAAFGHGGPAVNVLGGGMIRKKPKVAST